MAGNVSRFDSSSCSHDAQASVMKGLPFGGMPVVFLLNLSVVLALLKLISIMKTGKEHLESFHKKKRNDESEAEEKKQEKPKQGFIRMPAIIRMKLENVKRKCGEDAFHYLRLQHYLIVLMLIMSVMAVFVILPVNLSGDFLEHDAKLFGRTTIANLEEGLLWLPSLVAVLYLGLTVGLLRRYKSQLPRERVQNLLFIYSLTEKDKAKIKASLSSNDNYSVKDVYLCKNERKSPDMGFLIMEPNSKTTMILKKFNPLRCRRWCGSPVNVRDWKIIQAAHPCNFYKENLSVQNGCWWLKYLIHILLFILLFVFTIPTVMISTTDITVPLSDLISPAINQFFPTLLLWILSTVLPLIVYASTKQEGHYTRCEENESMIYKLYIFLLPLVLIMPSLGVTSLDALRLLLDKSFKGRIRLECIFQPDQGAFFVNYIITTALSGSAMELVLNRAYVLFRKKSSGESTEQGELKSKSFHKQRYKFPYGAMYAWNLCVFTVIMAHSITCPIIVPAGLVYLILKHLVDKHNLYYTCEFSELDRRVHLAAVNQAMAAPFICLLWIYLYSVFRAGIMALTTLFNLGVFFTTVMVCVALSLSDRWKKHWQGDHQKRQDEEPLDPVELVNLLKKCQLIDDPVEEAQHNQTSGQSTSSGPSTFSTDLDP